MVGQDDFPDKWACSSPRKKVRVEVRMPSDVSARRLDAIEASDTSSYTWIEIPTEEVEQYVAKGEAAQLQRSTKVRFPTEWGEDGDVVTNSPAEIITQYTEDEEQPFTWARVSFRDQRRDDAEWIVTQIGWIGGLGPASDVGRSKMWIYDPAELLSGTAIFTRLERPTVRQAAETVAKLTNDNTPIPLSEVEVVPPETEAEFDTVAGNVEDGDIIGGVGAQHRRVGESGLVYQYPSTTATAGGTIGPVDDGENFEAAIIDTGVDSDAPLGLDFDFDSGKTFKSNRDSLQDVYDYIEKKLGAKMHFEPQPDGHTLRLVIDIEPERRTFAQDDVVRKKLEDEAYEYALFQTVSVLKNDALYEMKPINTLRLDGEEGAGVLDRAAAWLEEQDEDPTEGLVGKSTPSDKYPYAKVQVPALLEAAEGVELGPREESDATTVSDVVAEAKTRLREMLEEVSEGEIFLRGQPEIMPFDALDAFEVCRDFVVYEQRPVRYEVEEVKHTATANGIYKTRLLVSVWANEKNIVVAESGTADATRSGGAP